MCDFSQYYLEPKMQYYTKEVISLRIISGKYKGKMIKGFHIDGTRPTMDRVKESLFAMIQTKIKGANCLDLYAGSGALGLEALSMGAKSCVFVDQNKIAIQTIRENTKGIDQVTILELDAFQLHKRVTDSFDLIFLDPPYPLHLIGKTLQYLEEKNFLKEGSIIVCEYEEEFFQTEPYYVLKERSYGKTNIKILKK